MFNYFKRYLIFKNEFFYRVGQIHILHRSREILIVSRQNLLDTHLRLPNVLKFPFTPFPPLPSPHEQSIGSQFPIAPSKYSVDDG